MATVPRQVLDAALALAPHARTDLTEGLATAKGSGRVEWSDYTVVLERLQTVAGSGSELERLTEESYHRSYPELTSVARQVVSPALFMHATHHFIARLMPLVSTVRRTDERTWHWKLVLNPAIPGSVSLFRGNIAAARGSMNHIGLPPASVDAVFNGFQGEYFLRLPKSAALHSRAIDASKDVVRNAIKRAGIETDYSPPPRYGRDILERVRSVGEALAGCSRFEDLVDCALKETRVLLECDEVSLWKRPGNGPRLELIARDGAPSSGKDISCFSLSVAGNEFGRIESCGGKPSPLLHALVPWLSLALAHGLQATSPQRRSLADCLNDAAKRWSLTPRQLSVLERAVQGLANKEIAAELNLSIKTVELHMTQLFLRTGARSRSQLVSLLFASPT